MATPEYTSHYRLPIPQFNSIPWHQQWEDSLRAVDEALYLSTISDAPAWQNSTQYYISNMTLDETQGTLWVATVDHMSPASPTTFAAYRAANPSHWQGISTLPNFKGAWVTGTLYNLNDFVTSSGKYAVAKVSHLSGASFAADEAAGKWETLVDTGSAFVGINDITTASVPAATTIDLGASSATRMLITGVAPGGLITSFGAAAEKYKILRFAVAGNTIVHNGTSLQLPDGQNIVTQANDFYYFTSDSLGRWTLWGMLRKFTATDFDDIKQPASQTYTGVVELATNAEAQAMADPARVITPANLAALIATQIAKGLVEFATDAEAQAQVDATRAITPANLGALVATAAVKGLVELATAAETIALTDPSRVITPAGLASLIASETQRGHLEIATDAETQLGVDGTRAVSPKSLASTVATVANAGLTRYASDAEAIALTMDTAALTPGNLGNVLATTAAKGIVELADDPETIALTVANRVVTPDGLGALVTSTTQRGIHRFATTAEAKAQGAATIGITPSNLADVSATRAEIEGGTSTNFVAAGNLRYGMGVAKAWGVASATGTLLYGHNMSGVIDGGVGIVTFSLNANMSSTLYPIFALGLHTSATDQGVIAYNAPAVGAFEVRGFNQAGAAADATRWLATAFGAHA